MIVLGIETSCDETASAVVRDEREVLSSCIHSQVQRHAPFGGVVPEIAGRMHVEKITETVDAALTEAGVGPDRIDLIAVVNRPGLIGALFIGVTAAKALAFSWRTPLIGIDHIQAHLAGAALENPPIAFPAVGFVISGGHTILVKMESLLHAVPLGGTMDDAAGEAFDKVAQLLSLPYPGGPSISKEAEKGDPAAIRFPRPLLAPQSLDFSFSGLKTAVRYHVQGQQGNAPAGAGNVADVAASFQAAMVDTLVEKCRRALRVTGCSSLVVGGGVAVNRLLRSALTALSEKEQVQLTIARPDFCTDNAAMAASLGAQLFQRQKQRSPAEETLLTLEAHSSSSLFTGGRF